MRLMVMVACSLIISFGIFFQTLGDFFGGLLFLVISCLVATVKLFGSILGRSIGLVEDVVD